MSTSPATSRRPSERTLLEQSRKLAQNTSNYFGLYWWLWHKGGASFKDLWSTYCKIVGRQVRFATVHRQLARLERYRAIKREGEYYYPLVDPEVLLSVVNVKRSQAGRLGAHKRAVYAAMGLSKERLEELRVPQLRHYVERVVAEVKKLVERGDRTATLDLLAHTLLPLRENETLWLWRGEEFLYWDSKNRVFRCVRSEAVSELLHRLGYSEGILAWHVLGHSRASKIVHSLFGKGWESWPWARSISYGLMLLGLVQEGSPYQIELTYRGGEIAIYLHDYFFGNTLAVYLMQWQHDLLPAPLSSNTRTYKGAVLGVPHSKPENDESYFSRWRA